MKTDPEIVDRVAIAIKKHCPQLYSKDPSAMQGYAIHIVTSFENRHLAFKVSEDVELLEQLERDLRAASARLEQLSAPTRRVLANQLRPSDQEKRLEDLRRSELYLAARLPDSLDSLGLLNSRQATIRSVQQSVASIRKSLPFRSKSKAKPRYDAAVVALACKKVWGLENPAKPPPKRIHFDRSHPMRSFIEQVFEELGIRGKDGHVFSAATALASLENLGGEGAYSLLVNEG